MLIVYRPGRPKRNACVRYKNFIKCASAQRRHTRLQKNPSDRPSHGWIPADEGTRPRTYVPDAIVTIDDGHGPLHPVVEIKGFRRGDAQLKAATMRTRWVPGVNRVASDGRRAFVEMSDVFEIGRVFGEVVPGYVQTGSAAA